MNLEDQVCDLGLSKKLKELGVRQESLFYWAEECEIITLSENIYQWRKYEELQDEAFGFGCQCCNIYFDIDRSNVYSAFTVTELGEILKMVSFPLVIKIGEEQYMSLKVEANLSDVSLVDYDSSGICLMKKTIMTFMSDNEANNRAKMLIYLIENNLVDVNKLNGE